MPSTNPAGERPAPKAAPIVSMTDIVFPEHTNSFNVMFGGNVLGMMDKTAVMASVRFARRHFVTISCDGIQFLKPIYQANIIDVQARVAWVGRTSLVAKVEVYREVMAEHLRELCAVGWFALAARNPDGTPAVLPELIIEDEAGERDRAMAAAMRERSIRQRADLPS